LRMRAQRSHAFPSRRCTEISEPTERYDPETGKRLLKANPVQISLLIIAQFGIPITLITIYKAVTAGN